MELEKNVNRDYLIYKASEKKKDKTRDFQKIKTIRFFGREIYNANVSLDDAFEQQISLKDDSNIFKESIKPEIKQKKKH